MKKKFFILFLLPLVVKAQDYFAEADSCLKVKNYACAATAYDLYLKQDSESNGVAYLSLVNWTKSGNLEKAFSSLKIYIRNNRLNNLVFFSKGMLNDSNLIQLRADPRWPPILARVTRIEDSVRAIDDKKYDSAMLVQTAIENWRPSDSIQKHRNDEGRTLYAEIKAWNLFPEVKAKWLSLQFKINDSLTMASLVVLPENYDSRKSYPLLFFLHGAVSVNTGFLRWVHDNKETAGWNRYYTKYGHDVIMVYAHGNREYNWMYPDKGFYMVPAILRQIKKIVNVDDNRVFVSGHSNGATGSFSYLMKQPSAFAGFYGFNTRPVVQTGGTFLKNALNRSFFNVSTDQDYYFPPGANDSLDLIMKSINADYQDHRYNGFPHWFPQFDESEPAYVLLFKDLNHRIRNPFHSDIYWECDNLKYGTCDWIQITGLDTAAEKVSWHKDINFGVHKWIILGDKIKRIERDTLLSAFKFPRRSAAIKAHYSNNEFFIETSRVGSFELFISPEMVDLSRKIKIILNGKLVDEEKVGIDKEYMLAHYEKDLDRRSVWVNRIEVKIK
ncbi:MAG TPA: hypothetical protein VKR32_02455 [Puia sp.]|nr:hypothetical protein [Puia sp.]